jgi:hypothetical protein
VEVEGVLATMSKLLRIIENNVISGKIPFFGITFITDTWFSESRVATRSFSENN